MIYFLSDAHLGSLAIERGWAHQKKLIDLLEEMSKDAVSIYMLGDMFDSGWSISSATRANVSTSLSAANCTG